MYNLKKFTFEHVEFYLWRINSNFWFSAIDDARKFAINNFLSTEQVLQKLSFLSDEFSYVTMKRFIQCLVDTLKLQIFVDVKFGDFSLILTIFWRLLLDDSKIFDRWSGSKDQMLRILRFCFRTFLDPAIFIKILSGLYFPGLIN